MKGLLDEYLAALDCNEGIELFFNIFRVLSPYHTIKLTTTPK